MANADLNKLCMEESNPMLKAVVRCKHDVLLHMQTSWSKSNPGRRFWLCPYYGSKNCKFFRWRDKEEVDPRSKFILPKLVNKIKELEEEVLRRQTQINEQVINNNNGVGSIGRCRFYWKIILCVLICVVAMFINNLFQSSESSIDIVELA
ncbi:hypothetical protein R3W88_004181 [Solanum pinnatisectum]|uniref:GRF-type domain-containing protein n=1 Tax=Solanum pinnatisectum TaxID=50273 RepID=A0AAV9K908_9SOLN|nr:hypothetical protein R3W88_004181 [Solanum pinnatisectum]